MARHAAGRRPGGRPGDAPGRGKRGRARFSVS